jgi:ABC-type molybdenum transport system ATPase subunit/photorepair protein PhrA
MLLLDEPFDGLDADGAELLHAELAERSDATALVATHDPEALAARATARLALA